MKYYLFLFSLIISFQSCQLQGVEPKSPNTLKTTQTRSEESLDLEWEKKESKKLVSELESQLKFIDFKISAESAKLLDFEDKEQGKKLREDYIKLYDNLLSLLKKDISQEDKQKLKTFIFEYFLRKKLLEAPSFKSLIENRLETLLKINQEKLPDGLNEERQKYVNRESVELCIHYFAILFSVQNIEIIQKLSENELLQFLDFIVIKDDEAVTCSEDCCFSTYCAIKEQNIPSNKDVFNRFIDKGLGSFFLINPLLLENIYFHLQETMDKRHYASYFSSLKDHSSVNETLIKYYWINYISKLKDKVVKFYKEFELYYLLIPLSEIYEEIFHENNDKIRKENLTTFPLIYRILKKTLYYDLSPKNENKACCLSAYYLQKESPEIIESIKASNYQSIRTLFQDRSDFFINQAIEAFELGCKLTETCETRDIQVLIKKLDNEQNFINPIRELYKSAYPSEFLDNYINNINFIDLSASYGFFYFLLEANKPDNNSSIPIINDVDGLIYGTNRTFLNGFIEGAPSQAEITYFLQNIDKNNLGTIDQKKALKNFLHFRHLLASARIAKEYTAEYQHRFDELKEKLNSLLSNPLQEISEEYFKNQTTFYFQPFDDYLNRLEKFWGIPNCTFCSFFDHYNALKNKWSYIYYDYSDALPSGVNRPKRNKPFIYLNNKRNKTIKSMLGFVLPHEVGHYLQHSHGLDMESGFGTISEKEKSMLKELEADMFAGYFSTYLQGLDSNNQKKVIKDIYRMGDYQTSRGGIWIASFEQVNDPHGSGVARQEAFTQGIRFATHHQNIKIEKDPHNLVLELHEAFIAYAKINNLLEKAKQFSRFF